MPKIKVNDISLFYETRGQGAPLVLISGFGCDHTMWLDVVPHLQQHYQVILIDNRGSGQSDAPDGDYSIEQMTQDVIDLCKILGIEKAHFVGNSMGGFLVQQLAYQHPEWVKSAIISNSAFSAAGTFFIYLQAQLEFLKASAPLPSILKASFSWLYSFQFLSKPGVIDEMIKMDMKNEYPFTIQGYEGQFAALKQFDSNAWANQIQVPVFVMSGDEDLIFSEPTVKLFASQISNATYYCFENCGHVPPIEYPEKFSGLILEYLQMRFSENTGIKLNQQT